ncbi:MAG: hypothetical protein FJ028_02290 [Chloroflexi bacterium]|nr:hypothetical protein [Chloroflexota bacterium]
MRTASLVPAGTEIAWALGAADRLVAFTHDCDFPPEVRAVPRLTSSTILPGATSREIDDLVRSAGERGESTFHLDGEALDLAGLGVVAYRGALGRPLSDEERRTLWSDLWRAANEVPCAGTVSQAGRQRSR